MEIFVLTSFYIWNDDYDSLASKVFSSLEDAMAEQEKLLQNEVEYQRNYFGEDTQIVIEKDDYSDEEIKKICAKTDKTVYTITRFNKKEGCDFESCVSLDKYDSKCLDQCCHQEWRIEKFVV